MNRNSQPIHEAFPQAFEKNFGLKAKESKTTPLSNYEADMTFCGSTSIQTDRSWSTTFPRDPRMPESDSSYVIFNDGPSEGNMSAFQGSTFSEERYRDSSGQIKTTHRAQIFDSLPTSKDPKYNPDQAQSKPTPFTITKSRPIKTKFYIEGEEEFKRKQKKLRDIAARTCKKDRCTRRDEDFTLPEMDNEEEKESPKVRVSAHKHQELPITNYTISLEVPWLSKLARKQIEIRDEKIRRLDSDNVELRSIEKQKIAEVAEVNAKLQEVCSSEGMMALQNELYIERQNRFALQQELAHIQQYHESRLAQDRMSADNFSANLQASYMKQAQLENTLRQIRQEYGIQISKMKNHHVQELDEVKRMLATRLEEEQKMVLLQQDLIQQLTNGQQRIGDMEAELLNVKAKARSDAGMFTMDRDGLIRDVQALQSELVNVRSQAQTEIQLLRSERDSLLQEVEPLRSTLADVKAQSQAELDQVKIDKDTLLQDVESFQAQLASVKSQALANVEKINSDRERLLQTVRPLQTQLANIKAESQAQLNKITSDRDEMMGEIETLQSELENRTAQADIDIESVCKERDSLQQNVRSLESDLESAKKNCDYLESELENRRAQADMDIQRVIEERDSLQHNLQSLESDLESAKKHAEYMQSELETRRAQAAMDIERVTEERDSLQQNLQSLESDLEAAKKNCDCLESELENRRAQATMDIDRVTEERDSLQHNLQSLESDFASVRKNCNYLESELENRRSQTDVDIQRVTEERDSLQHHLQSLDSDLESAKKNVEYLESELDNRRAQAVMDIERVTEERDTLQQNLQSLESDFASAKKNCDYLESKLEVHRTQANMDIQRVTEERDSFLRNVQSLQSELNSAKKNYAYLESELENRRGQAAMDIERVAEERNSLQHNLQSLESDLASARKNCDFLESKLENRRTQADKDIQRIAEERDSLLRNVQSLQSELTSAKKNYGYLESELESYKTTKKSDIESLRLERSHIKSQAEMDLQKVEHQRDGLLREVEAITSKLSSATQELKRKETECTELHNDRELFAKAANSLQSELSSAHRQSESLKSELSALNEDRKTLNKTIESLRTTLAAEKVQHQSAVELEVAREVETLRLELGSVKRKSQSDVAHAVEGQKQAENGLAFVESELALTKSQVQAEADRSARSQALKEKEIESLQAQLITVKTDVRADYEELQKKQFKIIETLTSELTAERQRSAGAFAQVLEENSKAVREAQHAAHLSKTCEDRVAMDLANSERESSYKLIALESQLKAATSEITSLRNKLCECQLALKSAEINVDHARSMPSTPGQKLFEYESQMHSKLISKSEEYDVKASQQRTIIHELRLHCEALQHEIGQAKRDIVDKDAVLSREKQKHREIMAEMEEEHSKQLLAKERDIESLKKTHRETLREVETEFWELISAKEQEIEDLKVKHNALLKEVEIEFGDALAQKTAQIDLLKMELVGKDSEHEDLLADVKRKTFDLEMSNETINSLKDFEENLCVEFAQYKKTTARTLDSLEEELQSFKEDRQRLRHQLDECTMALESAESLLSEQKSAYFQEMREMEDSHHAMLSKVVEDCNKETEKSAAHIQRLEKQCKILRREVEEEKDRFDDNITTVVRSLNDIL